MTVTLLGLQSRAQHTWLPEDADDTYKVADLRRSLAAWCDTWQDGELPPDSPKMQAVATLVAQYDELHMAHANAMLDRRLNPESDMV